MSRESGGRALGARHLGGWHEANRRAQRSGRTDGEACCPHSGSSLCSSKPQAWALATRRTRKCAHCTSPAPLPPASSVCSTLMCKATDAHAALLSDRELAVLIAIDWEVQAVLKKGGLVL